jgi:hypothetical protein
LNETIISENNTNEYIIEQIFEDCYVTVEFQTTHLTVNYNVINSEGGTITAEIDGENITSGESIKRGSRITFRAIPNGCGQYAAVKEWKNNGITIPNNTTYQYIVSSLSTNITITVEFDITPGVIKLSYSANNNQFGDVTATIDNTPVLSGAIIELNKNVIFSAVPNDDYKIYRWLNNGEVIAEYVNTHTLSNLTCGTNVIVEFIPPHATVSYSAVNDFGSVTAETETIAITSGDNVETLTTIIFTATPDEGYEVKEWRNNGQVVEPNRAQPNTYRIDKLTNDVNVTVEFQLITGISDKQLADIKIYPNPTNGIFKVQTNDFKPNEKIELYDILGRPLLTIPINNPETLIDISNLPNGVYTITTPTNAGRKIAHKIVKR